MAEHREHAPFDPTTGDFVGGKAADREAASAPVAGGLTANGRRKELLILRHAKSSWEQPSLRDFDRPLSARGKAAAPLMGRYIKDMFDEPLDCVLVSSAQRTRQTWQRLGLEAAITRPPMFLDSLYLAAPATIAKALREYVWPKARRVLLIGHNPGLQAFCQAAADAWGGEQDQEARARLVQKFPTAAMARFSLTGAWQSLGPKPASDAPPAPGQLESLDLNLADLRLLSFDTPRALQTA